MFRDSRPDRAQRAKQVADRIGAHDRGAMLPAIPCLGSADCEMPMDSEPWCPTRRSARAPAGDGRIARQSRHARAAREGMEPARCECCAGNRDTPAVDSLLAKIFALANAWATAARSPRRPDTRDRAEADAAPGRLWCAPRTPMPRQSRHRFHKTALIASRNEFFWPIAQCSR